MTAFMDAFWSQATSAMLVLGPIFTAAVALWLRHKFLDQRAESTVAEQDAKPEATNEEKLAAALESMKTVPMPLRPMNAKEAGARIERAVRARRAKQASERPPKPESEGEA